MGRIYVMSDIHGMGSLLERMLDRIGFSTSDHLYILGDMIDRGPEPAKVLDLVMSADNITALRGNHEDSFVEWYENEPDKIGNGYYYNTWDILTDSPDTMERLPEYLSFMKKLPLYKKLKRNGTCYLMAHASTEGILQLWKRKDMFLWDSSMVDRDRGIPGYISIVGHVPTLIIGGALAEGTPKTQAAIWYSSDGRLIDVDCGAAFGYAGGRLGCLCLDTGEEYYESSV